jgi:oligoribonuclease NrnB/cAMP/cGMP phosphodiesterase (DHH superfamily)
MVKVIYHKNCYDGITAAWVCRSALGDASYLPASYGDPVPEFSPEDEVYIVDFSYPRDVLEKIHSTVKTLWVLDHHKTAQAALEGLDYCIFDMNRSGAGIAWDFFYPGIPRPKLVDYVEDRDLWNWKLPFSHEINAFTSSYPMEFVELDANDASLASNFKKCVQLGGAILRYANQKVEEAIKNGTQWRELGGYSIPCVNVPYHMGSDVGHRLLEIHPEAPFSGYYLFTANGDEQWGLRGRDSDDFDVSTIAKQYGGGGHKKASGFLMNRSTRG